MAPPRFRRPDPGNPRDRGTAAERRVASATGLRRDPASGAASMKGDLRGDDVLVEVKSTKADSYRLDIETLRKTQREAALAGKRAAVVIHFTEQDRSYAVLPLEDVTD